MTDQRETQPTDHPTTPAGGPGSRSGPQRVRLRGPDDLLAAVPIVLGFTPQDSLVVLTFGANGVSSPASSRRRTDEPSGVPGSDGPGLHLRIDLPADPAHVSRVVEEVVAPCRRYGVALAAAVVYSRDGTVAEALGDELREAFDRAGIHLVDLVRADGTHWFAIGERAGRSRAAAGTPYDAAAHPARTEAVVRGRVVHASRDDLAALLDPLPGEERRGVERAVAVERYRQLARTGPAESAWVTATVERLAATHEPDGEGGVQGGRYLEDREAGRMLLALEIGHHRDASWVHLTRATSAAHLALWTDLLRRAPEGVRAGPAALTALAAWLHGNGALAWCAVDRCLDEVPEHGLGRLVGDLLSAATPPSWWDETTEIRRDPA